MYDAHISRDTQPPQRATLSVVSMVKGEFGDSLRSEGAVGQIGEVLAKMLCHNICLLIRAAHELGVEPIFGAGSGVEPKLFI
jgi:hypothetical protein